MQTFGASAPLKALQKEYGFTVDNVVARPGPSWRGDGAWQSRMARAGLPATAYITAVGVTGFRTPATTGA